MNADAQLQVLSQLNSVLLVLVLNKPPTITLLLNLPQAYIPRQKNAQALE